MGEFLRRLFQLIALRILRRMEPGIEDIIRDAVHSGLQSPERPVDPAITMRTTRVGAGGQGLQGRTVTNIDGLWTPLGVLSVEELIIPNVHACGHASEMPGGVTVSGDVVCPECARITCEICGIIPGIHRVGKLCRACAYYYREH